RPRWLRPALIAVVVATAAALAATLFLETPSPGPDAGPDRILREALSQPPPPTASLDDDLAVLTHPDFELLLASVQGTVVPEPAFHAWLVHQLDDLLPEAEAGTAATVDGADGDASAPGPGAGQSLPPALQSLAASLPPAARAQLAGRHARLQALPAP